MLKYRTDYLAFGKPDFTDAECEAVLRVLKSGWIGMGPETIKFEADLCDYLGASEVVTVNSCTSALFLALLVEGVGPGDEVIVPSLTWCASANAALYLGATPVLCDVAEETLCVGVDDILPLVTNKTKAVVVVHYGGLAVDVAALRDILPKEIVIVEDAAHALGARYPDGKMVGSSNNSVCFSFYANKNLSTADGGAIALFDREKAERLRSLRMSGLSSNAWSRFTQPNSSFNVGVGELGYKMNFTDLQASIGRVQLERMDQMADVRLQIAEGYREGLVALQDILKYQTGVFEGNHARHLFVTFFDFKDLTCTRDELVQVLRERNIGASIHYNPLHLQPFYEAFRRVPLTKTEYLNTGIVTLPISASMAQEDVSYVCDHLIDVLLPRIEN